MKHALYLVVGCMLLASVTLIQSCKDDEAAPDAKAQLEATWSLGNTGYVRQDGLDVTSEYIGLSLTFNSDGTYTATNAGKLFYPSGTWHWQSSDSWTVFLDGDFPVEVQQFNQTQNQSTLLITFDLAPEDVNASGRTNAVVGEYQILLTK